VTPYYSHAGIQIFLGDCREVLPTLGRFDLLLTDPPYGIGRDGIKARESSRGPGRGVKQYDSDGWDGSPPDVEQIRAMLALTDQQVIWGGNFMAHSLPANASWLVWDKGQRGLRQSDGELAWTSLGCGLRLCTINRAAIGWDGAVHPTQKPIKLMRWCLSFFPEARTVVDPYMGSGPVARACKDAGLSYVGIEIDERYAEIAAKRLAQEVLFGAP
jgi:DNA modification methylase